MSFNSNDTMKVCLVHLSKGKSCSLRNLSFQSYVVDDENVILHGMKEYLTM